MATIKRVIKALKNYFTTGDAGDIGLLESELYGIGLNSEVEAKLQDFVGYYPKINLEQLSQLPEGTLGYEYAQHMHKCGIQPLEISEDLREEADSNPLVLLIFLIIKPTQIKKTLADNRRGKALGKQAECLLIYRFEKNWVRPIADIRDELGLVLEDDELNTEVGSAIKVGQSQGTIAA